MCDNLDGCLSIQELEVARPTVYHSRRSQIPGSEIADFQYPEDCKRLPFWYYFTEPVGCAGNILLEGNKHEGGFLKTTGL